MKTKENRDIISVNDLYKKTQKGSDFTLLDVRTLMEYKAGHIKNAILLNLSEDFLKDLKKIGLIDKKKNSIIAYCRNGVRSQIIFNVLKTLGFKNVKDMQGGLLEWKKNKLPLIKE